MTTSRDELHNIALLAPISNYLTYPKQHATARRLFQDEANASRGSSWPPTPAPSNQPAGTHFYGVILTY